MEFIKKNITLVLGISIPILMILLVAASIYLPGLFIKPHFNFLYVLNDNRYYYNQQQYSVQNGKLVKNDIKQPENKNYYPSLSESKLYIHDIVKNESRELSFKETQSLNLDSNIKSPDGFEIVYGSRGDGFFPFFHPEKDYRARYLKSHNLSKKLNLQLSKSSRYNNNFRFLGWIK